MLKSYSMNAHVSFHRTSFLGAAALVFDKFKVISASQGRQAAR